MEQLARAARAVHLRTMGWQYHEIAEELGYSDFSGAAQAVRRYMQRTRKRADEDAEQIRQMELARIDMLIRSWLPRAINCAGMDEAAAKISELNLGKMHESEDGETRIVTFDASDIIALAKSYGADQSKAADIILKCIDRRAKLLGLDQQQDFTGALRVEYVNDWRGSANDTSPNAAQRDSDGTSEPANG